MFSMDFKTNGHERDQVKKTNPNFKMTTTS